ncbi:DUF1028 domain-containing protein [Micromonospora okii]|uniref:DUF1028 domain-containing protein n=1 Tax=Micromonospora okii TaxID=1182970 RepID=UPI00357109F7
MGALTARPAVGKLVAHVHSGGGAVATQATPNPFLAYDGLPLLTEGRSPQDVLAELLGRDPGREVRQVGMVDRQGRSHAFTGCPPATIPWVGPPDRRCRPRATGHLAREGSDVDGGEGPRRRTPAAGARPPRRAGNVRPYT